MPSSANRPFFLAVALLWCLPSPALAAGEPGDGLSLLKSNRYLEAIKAWEKDTRSSNADKRLRAIKGQAVAFAELGSLYAESQKLSVLLQDRFYKAVANFYNSGVLELYRGQLEFELGNWASCVSYMDKVLAAKDCPPRAADMAKVYRHMALNAVRKKNARLLLNTSFEEVRWQLAAFDPKAKPPAGKGTGSRALRCRLQTLTVPPVREDDLRAALDRLLAAADDPEMWIAKGELDQVDFSDPAFFEAVARACRTLALQKNLQLQGLEKDNSELVGKFDLDRNLAQLRLDLGDPDGAMKSAREVKGAAGQVLQGRILAAQGKKPEARDLLKKAADKSDDPAIWRDAGQALFETGLDKLAAMQWTQKAAEAQAASTYQRSYGSVLLGLGQKPEALEAYAKGYKYQYRNDISQNEPEYMLDYARAILLSGKMRYSEVVELLFHLQKAVPGLRQLHYQMQGIAAAEAVNDAQSETIFRKGN